MSILKMKMTEDLYTPADVKRVREFLTKEQNNLDLVTFLELPEKQHCLDHIHNDECFVRGVLHRQVNSYIGKLENNYVRMLQWWYPEDLPTFLEKAAAYLRREPDKRFRHNSWIKKLKTAFNKLNSKQMKTVLEQLGKQDGKNLTERKKLFAEVVLDRSLGYEKIKYVINNVKEQ